MTDDEIAAIRARHAADQERRDRNGPYYMVADDMHADRAALLAEVERLRADAAALREAGKRLLDNIDTGSYESEQQAVAEFRAALAASLAADGWPLVPREATLDMCQAAHEAMFEEPWNGTNEGVGAGIAAAIAAAPKTGETT